MTADLLLVDRCAADVFEFVATDPLMRRAFARAREMFFAGAAPRSDPGESELAHARLMDWFVFDHKLSDGRTPLEVYLRVRGPRLAEAMRAAAEDFRYNVYSVFEVVRVEPGRRLHLRDLADDAEYAVIERSASRELAPGAYVLGRLLPFREAHVLSAALSIWSADAQATIRAAYEQAKQHAGSIYISPLDMEPLFRGPAMLPAPVAGERAPAVETPPPAQPVGPPTREELRVYAALAETPWAALEAAQSRHRFRSPEELRDALDEIHRVFAEREARPRPSRLRARAPADAGPRERVLWRLFAAAAEREIPPDRYLDPAAAQAALRRFRERWLETPQERLGRRSPQEIIDEERGR